MELFPLEAIKLAAIKGIKLRIQTVLFPKVVIQSRIVRGGNRFIYFCQKKRFFWRDRIGSSGEKYLIVGYLEMWPVEFKLSKLLDYFKKDIQYLSVISIYTTARNEDNFNGSN